MSCQPGTVDYPVRSVIGYQFASRRVNAILSFLACIVQLAIIGDIDTNMAASKQGRVRVT
jgi:hypothetical protein